MHAVADVESWVQLAGALVVVALGAFVLSVRPRTRPNLAFGTFAVAFGAQFALTNLAFVLFDQPYNGAALAVEVPRVLLRLLATAGIVAVALTFPTPLRREDRVALLLPAALVAVVVGAFWVLRSFLATPAAESGLAMFIVLAASLAALHSTFALRAARASSAGEAKQIAFVASALVLYSGMTATAGFEGTRISSILQPGLSLWFGFQLAAVLVGGALWLRAAAVGPAPREARNVALLTAVMPLLGLLYVAFDLAWGALGIVRTAAVAVLAYGILRHHLLGIDVKVRWGISKTTIAAVFIAVFFVASEAAQEFFGETLGSSYVGILAAGALVFAIAPLSRLADRVAEKAVPRIEAASVGRGPLAAGAAGADAHEDTYRRAVRVALSDGVLDADDERFLARLADTLGIPSERALDLRDDVVAERPPERHAARGAREARR